MNNHSDTDINKQFVVKLVERLMENDTAHRYTSAVGEDILMLKTGEVFQLGTQEISREM